MGRLSRRGILLGGGVLLFAGAAASVVGMDRERLRRLLSPLGIRLADPRPEPAPTGNDGWLLTAEERAALEGADERVSSEVLQLREAVDLRGGTYAERRVASLHACVEACEADPRCAAFSYARTSHDRVGERRMCRLKSMPGEPVPDRAHYVSGRRDGW